MNAHRLTFGLTALAGLLGAAHVALTPMAYPDWTIDAVWFLGSGIAILVACAANVVGSASPPGRSASALLAINLVMAGFFAAAWSVLPGPQVIVGGAVFLSLAGCTLARHWNRQTAR